MTTKNENLIENPISAPMLNWPHTTQDTLGTKVIYEIYGIFNISAELRYFDHFVLVLQPNVKKRSKNLFFRKNVIFILRLKFNFKVGNWSDFFR